MSSGQGESDYRRSTQERAFEELRPEIVAAIRERASERELGPFEAQILACVETTSEKKKKGWLSGLFGGDPDPVHYTGALLTPSWLIWARSGEKSGVVVSMARLSEIELEDLAARLKGVAPGLAVPDDGVSVFGFVNRSPERVSAFLGLGPEEAARRFREQLKSAIAAARG